MIITRRQLVMSAAAVALLRPSSSEARLSCPGVDPTNGLRPPLSPSAVVPRLPEPRVVPAIWKTKAKELISLFELGRKDVSSAYANVSTTDQLSLGFLQWNHNAGSLYKVLLSDGGTDFIDAAPPIIRSDIERLLTVNPDKSTKQGADVIAGWIFIRGNKKLVRPEIAAALGVWLTSPPVKERQDKLIDHTLAKALQKADAWQRDLNQPIGHTGSERAFYSFTDLEVFNGGDLAGLWVDHIQEFRKKFADGISMLDFIANWVDDCKTFEFKGLVKPKTGGDYTPRFKKLYRRDETYKSVRKWRRLLSQGDARLNEDGLNLIAFGYLRAINSYGNDRPDGFHGVFQLDVLNRRGMMATGVGADPEPLYSL